VFVSLFASGCGVVRNNESTTLDESTNVKAATTDSAVERITLKALLLSSYKKGSEEVCIVKSRDVLSREGSFRVARLPEVGNLLASVYPEFSLDIWIDRAVRHKIESQVVVLYTCKKIEGDVWSVYQLTGEPKLGIVSLEAEDLGGGVFRYTVALFDRPIPLEEVWNSDEKPSIALGVRVKRGDVKPVDEATGMIQIEDGKSTVKADRSMDGRIIWSVTSN